MLLNGGYLFLFFILFIYLFFGAFLNLFSQETKIATKAELYKIKTTLKDVMFIVFSKYAYFHYVLRDKKKHSLSDMFVSTLFLNIHNVLGFLFYAFFMHISIEAHFCHKIKHFF